VCPHADHTCVSDPNGAESHPRIGSQCVATAPPAILHGLPLIAFPLFPDGTELERHADGGGAPGRGAGAHRRRTPRACLFSGSRENSRAGCALADAGRDLVRGADCRELRAREAVRHAACAAQKPAPAAPNDTRVRGAGPARKSFVPSESMQGPASPAADC